MTERASLFDSFGLRESCQMACLFLAINCDNPVTSANYTSFNPKPLLFISFHMQISSLALWYAQKCSPIKKNKTVHLFAEINILTPVAFQCDFVLLAKFHDRVCPKMAIQQKGTHAHARMHDQAYGVR